MKKGLVLAFLALTMLFPAQTRAAATRLLTEADGIRVGYDQGFLLQAGDKFSMKFGAFLQFQYLHRDNDDPAKQDISTFKVAKGRLRWTGYMYNPNIRYLIQLEVANGGSDKTVSLKDFAINLNLYPHAKFRIGQFKIPFNRQQLALFADLQFVDTSITSKAFNANQVNTRDVGVQVSGTYYDNTLQYWVGLFNGNGPNNNNDHTGFVTMARVVYNPFGKMSISESDMANSKDPLLSIGLGVAHDSAHDFPPTGGPVSSAETVALEFAYKYSGVSVQGEYYTRDDDLPGADADGYYLQAGVFLVPGHIEVAGRIGEIDFDVPNSDKSELTIGANIFFDGHRHKLQLDLSVFTTEVPASTVPVAPAREDDDEVIRLQYQVAF